MATGAAYHIYATASGLGNFSNVDELPKRLTKMHLSSKPQTPASDVAVILELPGTIYTAGVKASKYVKVVAEIRTGVWSSQERDALLKRVSTHTARESSTATWCYRSR